MQCSHSETFKADYYYEEGYLVEYGVFCKECGKRLGTWAYGSYSECEDDEYYEGRLYDDEDC